MQSNPQIKLQEVLKKRKFNPLAPRPEKQVCITVRGKIVGVNSSYIALTGLPKAGKSTYLTGLIASGFSPGEIFGMKLDLQQRRLGWFDTESPAYDWYKQIDRVRHLIGDLQHLPQSIDAYNVREDSPEQIRAMVNHYLSINDCGCLVIDGILDLINDFNDQKESKALTQWLKTITKKYSVCIVVILHQAKTNLNTIGHLGAAIDRYANAVIDIAKDHESGVITMKSKMMRSDLDFTPIGLKWNETHYMEVDPEAYKKPIPFKAKKVL